VTTYHASTPIFHLTILFWIYNIFWQNSIDGVQVRVDVIESTRVGDNIGTENTSSNGDGRNNNLNRKAATPIRPPRGIVFT
jgi:hypothetical protein